MTSAALTAIIVAVFAAETALVVALRNHRRATYIMVYIVALILLVYKSQEFIRDNIAKNGIYPVEFSHISYFVLGVTVVTGSKKMRAFAISGKMPISVVSGFIPICSQRLILYL